MKKITANSVQINSFRKDEGAAHYPNSKPNIRYPLLNFTHQGIAITDPMLSSNGFGYTNPQQEYGIDPELAYDIRLLNSKIISITNRLVENDSVDPLLHEVSLMVQKEMNQDDGGPAGIFWEGPEIESITYALAEKAARLMWFEYTGQYSSPRDPSDKVSGYVATLSETQLPEIVSEIMDDQNFEKGSLFKTLAPWVCKKVEEVLPFVRFDSASSDMSFAVENRHSFESSDSVRNFPFELNPKNSNFMIVPPQKLPELLNAIIQLEGVSKKRNPSEESSYRRFLNDVLEIVSEESPHVVQVSGFSLDPSSEWTAKLMVTQPGFDTPLVQAIKRSLISEKDLAQECIKESPSVVLGAGRSPKT